MAGVGVLGAASHLPGMAGAGGGGLIGLGVFSMLFFALNVIHGLRCWWLMLHPEREDFAQWEGNALSLFRYLPYGDRFWMVRIIHEPAFVMLCAAALRIMHILDRYAAIYLATTALFLGVKNSLAWYAEWRHLRLSQDARFAGPLVAAFINGTATDKDLAPVHLAGFARNEPREVRVAMVARSKVLPPSYAGMISPPDEPAAA
jgi:hypothetical protein